jgi:hypothetical protein
LAWGALLIELSSPLALLGKWPYRMLLGALASLQLGIWLLMGVAFTHMVALFSCLLPWHWGLFWLDRGWRLFGRRRAATTRGRATESLADPSGTE